MRRLRISDNDVLDSYKSFQVIKHRYPDDVGVYINDSLMKIIKGSDNVEYFNNYEGSKWFPVGKNKIEIKNNRTNTIIQTVNFTLTRDTLPEADLKTGGVQVPVGEKPNPPTDGNIIDWIEYWFKTLMYYLLFPFKIIFNALQSILEVLQGLVNSVSSLFTNCYTFLPKELLTLLLASVTLGMVLRVLGR